MHVIEARNVHDALPIVLRDIQLLGERSDSRNGPVIKFPTPLTVVFRNPRERVLFWPERDANPFFHFFESLWMLDGRRDVEFLVKYNKQMAAYSDDGETFHGAYGARWRDHFAVDQIESVIENLNANPSCRRQVIQMWDPKADLGHNGKDLPCNLTITFQIGSEGLNMGVFNRSNDIVWGLLGANAVHFSFLQEYIAASVGVATGRYYQITMNGHVYDNEQLKKIIPLAEEAPEPLRVTKPWNPYTDAQEAVPYRLFNAPSQKPDFDADLILFMAGKTEGPFLTPFFREVVYPLWLAYELYKHNADTEPQRNRLSNMIRPIEHCKATDWRLAALAWVGRRLERCDRKQD